MKTINLPKYAFAYRSPRAGAERDVGAQFRGDDNDSITVEIERAEGGQFQFTCTRSGISETCFSKAELAKVIECANALFASL